MNAYETRRHRNGPLAKEHYRYRASHWIDMKDLATLFIFTALWAGIFLQKLRLTDVDETSRMAVLKTMSPGK